MQFGPDGEKLTTCLESIATLIETYGCSDRADTGAAHIVRRLRRDAASTRDGDIHGAEHFRSRWELDDIYLSDRIADNVMREFHSAAFALAATLCRRFAFPENALR